MIDQLHYKGFLGTVEPQEDGTFYGKVIHVRDLITYEANTLDELITEFELSIDGYLADCEELGKCPDHSSTASW